MDLNYEEAKELLHEEPDIKSFPRKEHMSEVPSCKQAITEDQPAENLVENGSSSIEKAENQSNNDPHRARISRSSHKATMEI